MMLDTLSSEVLEHIFSFLYNKSDLLAVRLVCRQLCLKSFTVFATTWFSTINSDLSKQSLHRLEKIAQHETLRHCVSHLRIGAGHKTVPETPLGLGNHWIREDSGCIDTTSSIAISFRDYLADRLVNCRSFEVTDTCGRYPEQDGTSTTLSPADAVQLLLAATTGLAVRTFHIHQNRAPAILYPSQLSPVIIKSNHFQSAWATYLLDLELGWDLEHNHLLGMALDMVTTAANLRRLRLCWHNSTAAEHFFNGLGKVKTLPQISDLSMDRMGSITHTTLLIFLSRFENSLMSLSLSRVHLSSGSWSSIFGDFRFNLPHLERFTHWNCYEDPARGRVFFCSLRQNPKVQEYGEFQFLELIWKGKRRLGGVRYKGKGQGMQLALNTLQGSVYTMRRNGHLSPGYPNKNEVRKFDPMDSMEFDF